MVQLPLLTLLLATLLGGAACSVDIVPVSKTRLDSARMAEQPLLRGPGAPGHFVRDWKFKAGESAGLVYDPTQVEILDGRVRLKAKAGSSGARAVFPPVAQLQTSTGRPYVALDGFREQRGASTRGEIKYQLSNDGTHWFHFDGTRWKAAGPAASDGNVAAQVAAAIGKFHDEVGIGSLQFRVFLLSPTGEEPVELEGFSVEGIAPG